MRLRRFHAAGALLAGLTVLVLVMGTSTIAHDPVSNSPASSTPTHAAGPAPAADQPAFVHPGVLVSTDELNSVKTRLAGGKQPSTDALAFLKSRGTAGDGQLYSSPTYTAHPVARVQCGSTGKPTVGCPAQTDDAIAAYTHALLWYYNRDATAAQNAIASLNAWSKTLRGIDFDQDVDTNGMLEAGWGAQIWTRAAEIIRYTYTPAAGKAAFDVAGFSTMMRNVYLPMVNHGWSGGGANWLLSFADATMDIGVFLNDRSTFNMGVAQWRAQVPAAVYLTTDGPKPIPPPGTNISASGIDAYWYNPGAYENGLEGETCRDMSHSLMGLEAAVSGAETARIQGVDLYAEQQTRLVAGYEFAAQYLTQQLTTGKVPSWLCGGKLNTGDVGYEPDFELAYHAYHDRSEFGETMPYTKSFIDRFTRPTNYKAGLFMDWEELVFAS